MKDKKMRDDATAIIITAFVIIPVCGNDCNLVTIAEGVDGYQLTVSVGLKVVCIVDELVARDPVGEIYASTISVGDGVTVPESPSLFITCWGESTTVGDAALMGKTFSYD